jgi:hypothetical protein
VAIFLLIAAPTMKSPANINAGERQMAESAFNQLAGQFCVFLGKPNAKNLIWLHHRSPMETQTLQVGKVRRITVRIEAGRKLLPGQKCRVFVNHRLFD